MSGKPPEAIIQIAEERKADLIVLGSHGRTGVERLLMGSVAERVIVLASCPVLVVKGEVKQAPDTQSLRDQVPII